MYCTYCGALIPDQAVVCMNCGCATNNFKGKIVDNDSQYSDQGEDSCGCYDNHGCNHGANINRRSSKSGLVALVLLILCGTLGIHRMYMGKIGSGIAMLLLYISMITVYIVSTLSLLFVFGWVTAIIIGFVLFVWWVVDLVTLLSGKFVDSKGYRITLDR